MALGTWILVPKDSLMVSPSLRSGNSSTSRSCQAPFRRKPDISNLAAPIPVRHTPLRLPAIRQLKLSRSRMVQATVPSDIRTTERQATKPPPLSPLWRCRSSRVLPGTHESSVPDQPPQAPRATKPTLYNTGRFVAKTNHTGKTPTSRKTADAESTKARNFGGRDILFQFKCQAGHHQRQGQQEPDGEPTLTDQGVGKGPRCMEFLKPRTISSGSVTSVMAIAAMMTIMSGNKDGSRRA